MYNASEYQKTYITTTTSTVIFSGRGNLGGISINTTAAGAVTLYDGASPFAIMAASYPVGTYFRGVVISNGLTVQTAGNSDVTVMWTKG